MFSSKAKNPLVLFKIDLKKVFDIISQLAIFYSLALMDFPPKFIGWIRACIESPSFSCLINGQPFPFFHSYKGIRQGDCFLPIAIIVANIHSILLKDKVRINLITSFTFRGVFKISHLLYADDLVICNVAGLTRNLVIIFQTIFICSRR